MFESQCLSKTVLILFYGLSWIALVSTEEVAINHRLPGDTGPSRYDVFISVHLNPEFRFEGKVKIHLICWKETDKIQLHSSELDIKSIKLNGEMDVIESKMFVEEADFLIIKLKKKLEEQAPYTLEIDYTGKIRDDLTGLYRSSYFPENSTERRWLAVTQFQPSSARLVFPCYDEPHLKAYFTLTVEHDKDLHAISNMPIDKIINIENRTSTSFHRTSVRMSTYLFAFLVSDYEAVSNYKKTLNVWTNSDSLQNAYFALDFAENALEKFGEHFGPYRLPKLDLADIPDFKMGAMENWGMSTFRTIYIIYDNATSTQTNKLNAALLMAHEISHNWFGNEVTPAWWDYLWLSEGMATLLEAEMTDEIFPKWRMMYQFVVKKMQYAMIYDSKHKARAMSAHITSKDKILFDFVVYQKSGSVLWMLENILTQKVMRKGLDIYLKLWNGDIVDPGKFYASLGQAEGGKILANGIDLVKVMDSWTTQPGYPLVTVYRNYTNELVEISQQRFLSDGHEDLGTKYWVPITLANQSDSLNDQYHKEWLRPTDPSIIIYEKTGPKNWILVNKKQTGYYRVNYDDQNWLLLANTLNNLDYESIHVLNRAQILDDSLNLALAGILNYNITLKLVSYLRREKDYLPWSAAYDELNYISVMMEDNARFKNFMKTMIQPIFNQSEADSITQVFLRHDLLYWVCKFNLPECSQTKEIAKKWQNGTGNIVPDLVGPILCGALREDDEDLWGFVKEKLNKTRTVQERTNFITALACSESKDKLEEYLSMTIDENSILQKKERDTVFHKVYSSGRIGTEAALEFLVSNKAKIDKLYNFVDECIEGIAYYLTTDADISKLKSVSASDSAIDIAENNKKWIIKYKDTLSSWLEAEGYISSSCIHPV